MVCIFLVSLGINTLVVSVGLEELYVGDGFYDAKVDLVLRLSGRFFGIDIFIEYSHMLETCLRSYCNRSIFGICMVHLLSSWCVKMLRS